MGDVSKIDVVMVAFGWGYLGLHAGAGNADHWTVKALGIGMLVATAIVLSDA